MQQARTPEEISAWIEVSVKRLYREDRDYREEILARREIIVKIEVSVEGY